MNLKWFIDVRLDLFWTIMIGKNFTNMLFKTDWDTLENHCQSSRSYFVLKCIMIIANWISVTLFWNPTILIKMIIVKRLGDFSQDFFHNITLFSLFLNGKLPVELLENESA